ncbi:hypothetical protein [Desertivirga arenae]|uniref:hypothetical protein n=1 Tax=Desertivirga arenae TaxID=2810309 RepID=UPI001A95D2D5|nr:hypothetical protein [Pedobacter sp. SYSU D00823]
MESIFNSNLILGAILSLLFSVIAFFVRQLHSDFRRVEQNLSEIITSTEVIKANMNAESVRIFERINFHEKRLEQLEVYLLKHFEEQSTGGIKRKKKASLSVEAESG